MDPQVASRSSRARVVAAASAAAAILAVSLVGSVASAAPGDPATAACVRAAPTGEVTTETPIFVPQGKFAKATLTVRNRDSAGCAPSTFALKVARNGGTSAVTAKPTTWVTGSTAVAAGDTGRFTVTFTATKTAVIGASATFSASVRNIATGTIGTTTVSAYVDGNAPPAPTLSPKCDLKPARATPYSYLFNLKVGQTKQVVVTIVNPSSTSCPTETYALSTYSTQGSAVVAMTMSPMSLVLAPGASRNITITISSKAGAKIGNLATYYILSQSAYHGGEILGAQIQIVP